MLKAEMTGLPKDSVALLAQVITLDGSVLIDRCGKLPPEQVELVLTGLDIVLGR